MDNSENGAGLLTWFVPGIIGLVLFGGQLLFVGADALNSAQGIYGALLIGVGTFLYADHAWRHSPEALRQRRPRLWKTAIFLTPIGLAALIRALFNHF